MFLIGLYAFNNLISIIDVPLASNVYMNNKTQKIKKVKVYHKAAKENYIFSKMMENNKGGLINAVIILREVEDTTRVTVNLSGNAGVEVRNGYGVVSSSTNTCASRGIFEQKLFDDLRSF